MGGAARLALRGGQGAEGQRTEQIQYSQHFHGHEWCLLSLWKGRCPPFLHVLVAVRLSSGTQLHFTQSPVLDDLAAATLSGGSNRHTCTAITNHLLITRPHGQCAEVADSERPSWQSVHVVVVA